MKIPASKVIIATRWLVDCEVCGEAVEPEEGPMRSRGEAEAAKRRHLAEHERDEL